MAAKKKPNVASLVEQAGAQAFLRSIGANWHNTYLIIAIVAWLRVSEKQNLLSSKYGNPFNLKPGRWDVKLRTGTYQYRLSQREFVTYSKYASLGDAFKALAAYLKSVGNFVNGYDLIISSAKRGDATDLLYAIATSMWDAQHYQNADGKTNKLFIEYSSFTGLATSTYHPGKPAPKPKPFHPIPLSLLAPSFATHYLDGYAAGKFYRARHPRQRA